MSTVLITGASRGIGRALAQAYLDDGWRVLVTVRNPIDADGLAAKVLTLDVTDGSSVAALAAALSGEPLDVLVNNAGIRGPARQSSFEMDFDGFAQTLAVNTIGPLRVTQALLDNLRLGERPRVAMMGSRTGSLSYAKSDRIAYRSSKTALNKVTQCLATDLAPLGIAVASIHPGWVRTDLGGPDADIDVHESAAGVMRVIDQLTVETTGHFLSYDGTPVPW